ncbi:Flagellar biosynthesis protein, FliO [Rhizobium sp. NFR07]|uniref:flagellar biosynthetic protein FliO n=1 Tax=Rhizobium sp. NFR07 TaxID=1566262 RepID=UPI0008F15FAC|nr:flagellar biosynthetic protein FliO [Rhizobium sp. NFR07]SFB38880.1 Flagellar biosynthesis protein, FliO [Rhizobium sp. NFR07]
MFEDLIGAYGGRLVVAVLGVGAALLCLIGILWIVRGRRGPSPFVRGGRNRNPRLQVLDAAAVDTRRRLVLVRRDDVEHLIMIGGPTDIVIESRISPSPQTKGADSQPHDTPHTLASGGPAPLAAPAKSIPAPAQAPVTRPTATAESAAIPQPRTEPQREQVKEPPARDIRAAQPAADVAPVNAAPSSVAMSTPIVAAPAGPVIPEIATPAQAPIANGPAAATVVPIQRTPEIIVTPSAPALDDAAKLLDSARDRVFAERPAHAQAQTQAQASAPAARPAPPVGQHPTALGSDFERILEEEMATNLAARDAALIGRGSRPLPHPAPAGAPTVGPTVPVPGASRQDPPLQAEVARIFGEMSASRDK